MLHSNIKVKKIFKELKISLLEHHKLAGLLFLLQEIRHNRPDKAQQHQLRQHRLHRLHRLHRQHQLHHLPGSQMSLAVCKNQQQQNCPLALGNKQADKQQHPHQLVRPGSDQPL
jgi:hypothetical protein